MSPLKRPIASCIQWWRCKLLPWMDFNFWAYCCQRIDPQNNMTDYEPKSCFSGFLPFHNMTDCVWLKDHENRTKQLTNRKSTTHHSDCLPALHLNSGNAVTINKNVMHPRRSFWRKRWMCCCRRRKCLFSTKNWKDIKMQTKTWPKWKSEDSLPQIEWRISGQQKIQKFFKNALKICSTFFGITSILHSTKKVSLLRFSFFFFLIFSHQNTYTQRGTVIDDFKSGENARDPSLDNVLLSGRIFSLLFCFFQFPYTWLWRIRNFWVEFVDE